ncbi:MAG: type II secretion system F family protein, partial [Candidatus Eremiobacteraeota bacterium]|nr:type II secretion system F family protein [Candidatus Eremiobacteraeota bacterium]
DMLIQMSAMGEEAGSLPDMMERVADYYDEEVDASVDALTALLEPSMMILIGGVVCVFVMGVLLPILGVSSSVQEQM